VQRFIRLTRGEGVATLEIDARDSNPAQPFRVLGGLPHNITIGPRTVADARLWIATLERWIAEQVATGEVQS
jgi:hypothetical protein